MGKPKISIIVALDSKGGIGKNNDLLFRIPLDFERMKKITSGHPLVMGRKTFESIGRVLPGRTNIVITSNPSMYHRLMHDTQNLKVCKSLEEGLEIARRSSGSDEVFVFGGGQVFKEALEKDLVDRLYLTIVEGDFGADTFFPDYSEFKKVISEEDHSDGKYKFKFLTLEKN